MFKQIWHWILNLFGKQPLDKRAEQDNQGFTDAYEDIKNVSFCAIFSNALASRAVSDSSITVTDAAGNESRRSEFIAQGIEQVWKKSKSLTAQALGKGGKVLVPYVVNGKPWVDIVDQSRMRISAMQGDEIVSATILAEITRINDRPYYRWIDYTLADGVHTILTRATTESGGAVSLDIIPEWADIEPEIVIQNVEHILFGYLKSPTDSRRDQRGYGVPITYGSEHIIADLHTCLDDMAQEFKLKKAFVGVDSTMFDKNNRLPGNGLFKTFRTPGGLDNKNFWEVYDPAIRDSAYLSRFKQLCALLEQSIGTAPGILTDPTTQTATATAIRHADYATFSLVDSVRQNIETAINQLAYALDVLAEYTGATPAGARGDYVVTYDWDMSMLESSTETFQQLSELESRNLISSARLVSWVTGDSMENAEQEVLNAQEAGAKAAIVAYAE